MNLPDSQQRAFVERFCVDDPVTRDEVLGLLEANREMDSTRELLDEGGGLGGGVQRADEGVVQRELRPERPLASAHGPGVHPRPEREAVDALAEAGEDAALLLRVGALVLIPHGRTPSNQRLIFQVHSEGPDATLLPESLDEAAKGAEMARLEFQGRLYIGDALFISVLQKV